MWAEHLHKRHDWLPNIQNILKCHWLTTVSSIADQKRGITVHTGGRAHLGLGESAGAMLTATVACFSFYLFIYLYFFSFIYLSYFILFIYLFIFFFFFWGGGGGVVVVGWGGVYKHSVSLCGQMKSFKMADFVPRNIFPVLTTPWVLMLSYSSCFIVVCCRRATLPYFAHLPQG